MISNSVESDGKVLHSCSSTWCQRWRNWLWQWFIWVTPKGAIMITLTMMKKNVICYWFACQRSPAHRAASHGGMRSGWRGYCLCHSNNTVRFFLLLFDKLAKYLWPLDCGLGSLSVIVILYVTFYCFLTSWPYICDQMMIMIPTCNSHKGRGLGCIGRSDWEVSSHPCKLWTMHIYSAESEIVWTDNIIIIFISRPNMLTLESLLMFK